MAIIAKAGGLFAALAAGIMYFYNKESKYITQIQELNKELRDTEKETLQIISKLTITLDKVVENDKSGKDELIKEIQNLRDIIIIKIDKLDTNAK